MFRKIGVAARAIQTGLSDPVIDKKEQHQIYPQPVQKVPVNAQQAQLQPFFRIGKVNQHAHRLFHVQAGIAVKYAQERQARDDMGEVKP